MGYCCTDDLSPSGQARRQVVITLDRWANELPPEAKEVLTPEEQHEWARWKAEHDTAHPLKQAERELSTIARALALSSMAPREGFKDPSSETLWPALDAFTAALNAGETRPKRPRGRPKLKEQKP